MEKAKANTVKILEVCKVSPFSNSPNSAASNFTLPLASFDWLFLKFPPTERVFFYALTDSDPPFFDSILPQLKHSLSLTLSHFLPLAGNLVWPHDSPQPFILYTPDDAVSFTVSETDSDFNHLSDSQAREIEEYRSFIPTMQASDTDVPIMAIQVTKFQTDGFVIGMTLHHVLFDGKSVSLFWKAWAYICKRSHLTTNGKQLETSPPLLPELTPSFERGTTVLQDPADFIPQNRSLKFLSFLTASSDRLRGTFELTHAHIEKLKKRVLEKCVSEELHLSTFVVAYAYALICLIKAKQGESDPKLFYITFIADVRLLLDPPVSSNYIGNCIVHRGVVVEERVFTEEDGFPNIAEKISDLILGLKSCREFKAQRTLEVQSFSSGVEICGVAASPKFKHYETDFGWGKPKRIDIVSLGVNSISLTDTRDGNGGVEVNIVLPTHQILKFASLFVNGLN